MLSSIFGLLSIYSDLPSKCAFLYLYCTFIGVRVWSVPPQVLLPHRADHALRQDILHFGHSPVANLVIQPARAETFPQDGISAVGDVADLPQAFHLHADGLMVVLVVGILDQRYPGALVQELVAQVVVGASDRNEHFLSNDNTPSIFSSLAAPPKRQRGNQNANEYQHKKNPL